MITQTQQPTSELSGAVVLITGALTGIGRATALAFAKAGSRVVVSGRPIRTVGHCGEQCGYRGEAGARH